MILILTLTHLAAAAAPFIFITIKRRVQHKRDQRLFHENFWQRQSFEALEKAKVLATETVPAPPDFIVEWSALSSTRMVVATLREQGLFNMFDKTPVMTIDEVATNLGISTRQFSASLEVLLAAGVVAKQENGITLTPMAHWYLREESPLFNFAMPAPKIAKSTLKTLNSGVVPGAVANWAKGKSSKPHQWATGMHRVSFPLGFALSDTGLLSNASNIMDVAGGAGSVCIALTLKNPKLQATVLELPGSISSAEKMISQYGLSDRISCIGANMFEDNWPRELDAILFTNIFHDWEDDKCKALAKKAYESLQPGGLIMLQEALLNDDGPGPLSTASLSLHMALQMQGRQFRGGELISMLKESGFVNTRVVSVLGHYSTVVGYK